MIYNKEKPFFQIKDKFFLLIMILGLGLILFASKDIFNYLILINGIYATFLMSIGIIVINTYKLNNNKESIFLGSIFGIVGILNTILIFINFYNNKSVSYYTIGIMLEHIISIIPVIGMYICFYGNRKCKNISISIISIISISLILILILTGVVTGFSFKINNNSFKIINYLISTITVFISVLYIVKKLKNGNNFTLNSFIVTTILSRLNLVFNFWADNVYAKYAICQTIMFFSIIGIYRYIMHTNINSPYKELNIINKELTNTSNELKIKNHMLVENSKKIKKLKKMTEEKEAQLQARLDASINSVVIFNEKYEMIYTNRTFIDTFVDHDKISRLDDFKKDFINYETLVNGVKYVLNNRLSTTEPIYHYESKVYQCTFAPLIINSKMQGALCILVDKTSEKAFENEIIQTNKRYESFLESIGDGIVVIEDGIKVYINKACREIFKNKVEVIDFPTEFSEEYKEELYIIDGEPIYVEMSFSEYTKYGKNKSIVIVRDITGRKKSQIKLKESQVSYERLIDILPDGICLLKENLSIDYANKSFLKILGVKNAKDIEGSCIKTLLTMSKEEEYVFDKQISKVISKNKHILLIENELITKSKTRVQIEINALPFMSQSDKYIMFIIKDITHRKTSEKAEKELIDRVQTDKVKTELFANMSHELKTPLNVISSSNQLVDSFYKSGKIHDYNHNIKSHIDLVRQNSYRLQRLINNIIDLTKMESGYYSLSLGNYNIVSIVEDLFMKIENYTKKKGISITFDTDIEEAFIKLDKYQIERVLLNLLSNCIKFTPNYGQIYVNIYDRKNEILISVKDTGVGIPEIKLETIFEEFTQVDDTLSRNTEGSGVGLAIARNLIELHGGSIKVNSKENKGTEFLISIPYEEVDYEIIEEDKSIYNIDEKIKIEFSDIYY